LAPSPIARLVLNEMDGKPYAKHHGINLIHPNIVL